MKIATFFLACMAWIKCTISPLTPADEYDVRVRFALTIKSNQFAQLHVPGNDFRILDNDLITMHKVKNGKFADRDIVQGDLHYTTREDHHRTLEHPPGIEDQHGEVEVTLRDRNFLYHSYLKKMPYYRNRGHPTRLQYVCTIERGNFLQLVALLRLSTELPIVPDNVPRVRFANHLHENIQDEHVYTGELFPADPAHLRTMFVNMETYARQQ